MFEIATNFSVVSPDIGSRRPSDDSFNPDEKSARVKEDNDPHSRINPYKSDRSVAPSASRQMTGEPLDSNQTGRESLHMSVHLTAVFCS